EHLASILRDEPQPVIPQHEDIARKKIEEAERSAAARAPEMFAAPRREGLVDVEGGEGGTVTVTVHRDTKVFIEGDSVTVWSRADDRPVMLVSSPYYADLLRKTLDPDDERWATRDEVPKLGGRLIDTAKDEEGSGGPREGL
ncbi:hypothetical protein, partial [uncultured Microbacterium sp.]|uniref:hypothetical protein n=1 Tax=uncultured Microbacterium sp. TaxID=191216 RepID=UPI0025D61762